jgi:tetratricopeptide (TPR) repeat protein
LLTGFAGEPDLDFRARSLPGAAVSDLETVGAEPALLPTLYVMRGNDLKRFAGSAPFNTDDDPRLEFHGQRDLHAQTNLDNAAGLASFPRILDPPTASSEMTVDLLLTRGTMFERAEAPRLAFRSYQLAIEKEPNATAAIVGMDRCARTPEERAAVARAVGLPPEAGSLEIRSQLAIERAKSGDFSAAEGMFKEIVRDFSREPAAHYNYGIFCVKRREFQSAISHFRDAIALDEHDPTAYEGMTAAYLGLGDLQTADFWNRKILELDPSNARARQTQQKIRAVLLSRRP